MGIGNRIREERKARGLTQQGLAQRANMSLNGLAQLEQGERTDPHYSTLSKIASALGLTVWDLTEERGTESAGDVGELLSETELKRKPREELFELKDHWEAERSRLAGPITRNPSPQERRRQVAHHVALLNWAAVRDELDRRMGLQPALTPDEEEEAN